MPKFRVTIERTFTGVDRAVVEVEAPDEAQAEADAYDLDMGDLDWWNKHDETQQYDVTNVEEI